MLDQRVCVVGLGYIGLPTASLLATKGFSVLGVDVSRKVVDTINKGDIHIVEPGLDILVKSGVNSGNLTAALKPKAADIFILAVPTPFDDKHQPDLTYVDQATDAIAKVVKPGNLVILESTSPVGTTERIAARLVEENSALSDVYVAHCPERVIPGRVLQELVENDRVVGGINAASTKRATEFYASFVQGGVLETDAKTAELCKLTENAFRDTNIAFANELSLICEHLDINVWALIELANRHPRVSILQPGPGVGGHCIAVDPWFIIASAPKQAKLMKTARQVNDHKPQWVVDQVKEKAKRLISPVITCFGVSFKADIDDLRESPALWITQTLAKENVGKVLVCEPHIESLEGFELVDWREALAVSDIIVILVDHKAFKQIHRDRFLDKCVIDTRGVLHA